MWGDGTYDGLYRHPLEGTSPEARHPRVDPSLWWGFGVGIWSEETLVVRRGNKGPDRWSLRRRIRGDVGSPLSSSARFVIGGDKKSTHPSRPLLVPSDVQETARCRGQCAVLP